MCRNRKMEGEFDYIIVGAGSAGCVLANRLSANPTNRVLLLEAGGNDNWIWFHIPVGYLFAIGNPRADWLLKTEAQPGLNGRSLNYPRGKVVGGSSAINGMIYMLGQSADYDNWRQLGLPGWSWEDVRPYFRKHVDHFLKSEHHGAGGEWRVEHPRLSWEILDAFREAANQYGIPTVDDFNTGDNEGICYFHVNQKRGRRWSAARGFLKPVMHRQNLQLETGCLVEGLELTSRHVSGVRWRQNGEQRAARSRGEVILAAGSIGSPHILMLSGIGPALQLSKFGIPIALDRPGVGANLHDHLQLRMIYKVSGVKTLNETYSSIFNRVAMGMNYAFRRRGPMTMAPSQLGAFTRSDSTQDRANIQYHVQPLSLDKFGEPLHPFPAFTASVTNVRPTSRGALTLKSADPGVAPAISPNYLATPEDQQVAADSIRVTREIVRQPALQKYSPVEYLPGESTGDDDEASLVKAAGDIGTTIFHPVGTARMGRDDDARAVVDARLRVIGMERLRVVDASVMPSITSGNTNSPTMMIAEKGAAMILEDQKRL
ncbi:MAG TPA: GMC family oxidoreductase N-terminal domain-containing protein [Pseudolabrys sp.]|nr:GMC family oxidoreductase N-terminal domain-containing protein [Pseudolabrys sp.]